MRPFFVAPKGFKASALPNGNVGFIIGPAHPSLGFSEEDEIEFAAEMSPNEALALADLLVQKAREALGEQSPNPQSQGTDDQLN